MERETTKRKMIVVSATTATELQEYLGFRHFARHAYPLDLEWDLMKDLIERLPVLHSRVLAEIGAFVAYLKTLPTTTQSHETKDQYGGKNSFFRRLRQTIRSFFSSVLVLNAVEAAPPHSVKWR